MVLSNEYWIVEHLWTYRWRWGQFRRSRHRRNCWHCTSICRNLRLWPLWWWVFRWPVWRAGPTWRDALLRCLLRTCTTYTGGKVITNAYAPLLDWFHDLVDIFHAVATIKSLSSTPLPMPVECCYLISWNNDSWPLKGEYFEWNHSKANYLFYKKCVLKLLELWNVILKKNSWNYFNMRLRDLIAVESSAHWKILVDVFENNHLKAYYSFCLKTYSYI